MPNPFKPTAGKMPPILIGRGAIVEDFTTGLRNGAGAPERLMLITGQRGYGKTVMLTELEEIARTHGWETYHETASEGMVERLLAALRDRKAKIGKASIVPSVSIPGIASVGFGKLEIESAQQAANLRDAINARLKKLPKGKGIMFAIDESQAASRSDLVALATTVQHVIHDEDMTGKPDDEQHGIAFVFAALPNLVDDLVNDKVLTFMRRAVREELGPIYTPDIRNAYMKTIVENGKAIDMEVAEMAAKATGGNPFLVQLIGYYMWELSDARFSTTIEQVDVEKGERDAMQRYNDAVCIPLFASLTLAQQEFLVSMVQDYPNASRLSDVAERAQKSESWADKYRISLIRAQVVISAGPGKVAYAVPHFGEWITERQK